MISHWDLSQCCGVRNTSVNNSVPLSFRLWNCVFHSRLITVAQFVDHIMPFNFALWCNPRLAEKWKQFFKWLIYALCASLITELKTLLSDFIEKETTLDYDREAELALQRLTTGDTIVNQLTSAWARSYVEVTTHFIMSLCIKKYIFHFFGFNTRLSIIIEGFSQIWYHDVLLDNLKGI